MSDPVKELHDEFVRYVGMKRRLGDDITIRQVAVGHRQVCIENLRDDGDDLWIERVKTVDRLIEREFADVVPDPPLAQVLREVAEIDRRRRASR